MKLVVFGLSVSSSWGNGHATIWRGLIKALHQRGHRTIFYERDVPYYASHRDLTHDESFDLRLYGRWEEVRGAAFDELEDADAAIITSYCTDAIEAFALARSSDALSVFYDLDAPVTIAALRDGKRPFYIGADGLKGYDAVLSYTGGASLVALRDELGARSVYPLYGSVDPGLHRKAPEIDEFRADLSYLGTYAEDRQKALSELFIKPAKRLREKRFLIGGSLYPEGFPWADNIFFVRHVPPPAHPAFYSSSASTLNVTRGAMAAMGWCPSGRLFEAAACGTHIISDNWPGLDEFFIPGEEITIAGSADDVVEALGMDEAKRRKIAEAGRERALKDHTALKRAVELEAILGAYI